MKTLFICAESAINDHVGEEYDDIIEVPDVPTTFNIEQWARRIRDRIRKVWQLDRQSGTPEANLEVQVYLAASGVYNAMMIDYQHVMGIEENIRVSLPYLESPVRTTRDKETQELLSRLPSTKGDQ